jgi:hypothetical protein
VDYCFVYRSGTCSATPDRRLPLSLKDKLYYINLNQDIVDMFEVKKHVKKDNLDCTKRQLAFKVEVACHKYAGQVVPSMNKIYNCVKSCYDDMQNNLWVQRTTLSTTPSI